LTLALRGELARPRFFPQPFRPRVGVIFRLLEFLVEPATVVLATGGAERTDDLPVVARTEGADLFFALDQDGERRRLHASHSGELEAARFGIERGHRPRAVDAHQPVRFRPTDR